ncbi:hypothetical protein WICPIJ_000913 [Wickerhamomyces pijperi]|uniref:Uncharacterized protein n=1 Tax=Wickerhamomyces pijperi TaxID=599730 RepID=A0A9P8QBT0_WICPI|nr:hypothetical protein WICPIJ_000913 [Wickerhamomyces pijperi]
MKFIKLLAVFASLTTAQKFTANDTPVSTDVTTTVLGTPASKEIPIPTNLLNSSSTTATASIYSSYESMSAVVVVTQVEVTSVSVSAITTYVTSTSTTADITSSTTVTVTPSSYSSTSISSSTASSSSYIVRENSDFDWDEPITTASSVEGTLTTNSIGSTTILAPSRSV